MKFAVFVPNSRKLSLILTELVHKLGTRTPCDTLHTNGDFRLLLKIHSSGIDLLPDERNKRTKEKYTRQVIVICCQFRCLHTEDQHQH